MPSQASLQAPVLPGSVKMQVPSATPAIARLWMVDVPMVWKLNHRNSSPKPGISSSTTA